jgi:predicted RNase H-like HicB family nuclease
MLTRYFDAAMAKATTERMEDGRSWAEIPGFAGVWGVGTTPAAALKELRSALEDWVLFSLQRGHPLPIVDGLDLNVKSVA